MKGSGSTKFSLNSERKERKGPGRKERPTALYLNSSFWKEKKKGKERQWGGESWSLLSKPNKKRKGGASSKEKRWASPLFFLPNLERRGKGRRDLKGGGEGENKPIIAPTGER